MPISTSAPVRSRSKWRLLLGIFAIFSFAVVGGVVQNEPAHAAGQSVHVYVVCNGDGSYSAKATIEGAADRKTYTVYYQITSVYSNGSTSPIGWSTSGNVWTGIYGIGSTNTIYGGASSRIKVIAKYKINGTIGTGSDTCGWD